MNQIVKSIEGCWVAPIPPKRVGVSDYYAGDSYGVLGNFVWVGVCILSFIILANIPKEKPGWIWFAPFIVPFFVRFWLIDALRGKDAQKYRDRINEQNHQQSIKEAEFTSINIKRYVSSALEEIQELKTNLNRATSSIQLARSEFDQNAYSPFWDKVHVSIECLSECQKNLQSLERYAELYSKSLSGRDHNFPAYPVSAQLVPDVTRTSQELSQVIRLGQTSFEFSSIYEQIRTREVMIAGFKSLGEAVENFGRSVDHAFSRFLSQMESTIRQTSKR